VSNAYDKKIERDTTTVVLPLQPFCEEIYEGKCLHPATRKATRDEKKKGLA
jgi:hypothetical protein